MAIGVDVTKTTGRLVFELERGEETTTRSIDIPYPKTDTTTEDLQNAINDANTLYTATTNYMNTFIQPATWRDDDIAEKYWKTTRVYYEIVTTTTTPIEPDEISKRVETAEENATQAEEETEHQDGQHEGI